MVQWVAEVEWVAEGVAVVKWVAEVRWVAEVEWVSPPGLSGHHLTYTYYDICPHCDLCVLWCGMVELSVDAIYEFKL